MQVAVRIRFSARRREFREFRDILLLITLSRQAAVWGLQEEKCGMCGTGL